MIWRNNKKSKVKLVQHFIWFQNLPLTRFARDVVVTFSFWMCINDKRKRRKNFVCTKIIHKLGTLVTCSKKTEESLTSYIYVKLFESENLYHSAENSKFAWDFASVIIIKRKSNSNMNLDSLLNSLFLLPFSTPALLSSLHLPPHSLRSADIHTKKVHFFLTLLSGTKFIRRESINNLPLPTHENITFQIKKRAFTQLLLIDSTHKWTAKVYKKKLLLLA